jgi:hypothetical protein
VERTAVRATATQIRACRSGGFPVLIEETDDEGDLPRLLELYEDNDEEDDPPPEGVSEPEGGVPLSSNDPTEPDVEIEDSDHIFVANIHPFASPQSIRAVQTVSQLLAEAFTKNSDTKSFCDLAPECLHDFDDVFSEGAFDSLPEPRKWDHMIELEREPSPGFRKVYPMTREEQGKLDVFLEEALRTGRIRQSKSPIGAPVFFIKKKDGKL